MKVTASPAPPRVSVVVTCYNLGAYLDQAVDSVLAQSFQDLEVVVVDDGSTDPDTLRRLADYRRPRTRVIRSENRGLPAARNLGIRESGGAYLCTLDADDVLEPPMLERSVTVLDRDPSVAFVSHWLRTFGDEVWEWTPGSCDFPALLDANTVNGAALVRRAVFEAAGGFDESMRQGCEDWDLWITLVERGYRGVILPEFLFRYRRRADSMSRLMARDGANLQILDTLVRKHADTYRRHLAPLVARRAAMVGDLLHGRHELMLEEARWLGPELRRRQARVALLRAQAARPGTEGRLGDELRAARAETVSARAEAAALRASMSWRVTAPVRLVHGALLRAVGRIERQIDRWTRSSRS